MWSLKYFRCTRSHRRPESISSSPPEKVCQRRTRVMRIMNRHREHGIALLLSVLALLLLSAVAVGMIYMASTENSIAANFKSEETEYFAARAGVEEVRDRMIPGVTNSISAL